jgi:hypothetical protein
LGLLVEVNLTARQTINRHSGKISIMRECKLLLTDASGSITKQVSVAAGDALAHANLALKSDLSISAVEIWSLRQGHLARLILRLDRAAERELTRKDPDTPE